MCSCNHLELSSPMSSFTHPPLLSMYSMVTLTQPQGTCLISLRAVSKGHGHDVINPVCGDNLQFVLPV
jgi:hypothetical protein